MILKPFCKNNQESYDIKKSIELLEKKNPNVRNSACEEKELGDSYDLDIIIPAYNVEKHIADCLYSVLHQKTNYQYRVIVIDDGATDQTGKLIDAFSEHENILIVHQENTGISGARNNGLRCVDSKYVMFVDADDMLAENAIESLLSFAYEVKADIVQGGYTVVSSEGHRLHAISQKSGKLSEGIYGYPWGKVYKTNIFNSIIFPEKYWFEDSIIRQLVCEISSCNYGISNNVYFYRRNPNGITSTAVGAPKSIDSLWITLQLFEDRQKMGLHITQSYYEYILRMIKLTYNRTSKLEEQEKKAIFRVSCEFIERNFGSMTSQTSNIELEKALHERNYNLYQLFCKLM